MNALPVSLFIAALLLIFYFRFRKNPDDRNSDVRMVRDLWASGKGPLPWIIGILAGFLIGIPLIKWLWEITYRQVTMMFDISQPTYKPLVTVITLGLLIVIIGIVKSIFTPHSKKGGKSS